jgi:hypothetical protein
MDPLADFVPVVGLDFLRMEDNPKCEAFEKCVTNFIDNQTSNNAISPALIVLGIIFVVTCLGGGIYRENHEEFGEEQTPLLSGPGLV